MRIRFHNTLTHQVEDFVPLDPPRVSMYNCGPTVYDFAHIGNFRAFLFADVLRRFLELAGHEVRQVMNLTDVGHMVDDQLADGGGEDKMEVAARRLKEAKKAGKAEVDNPDDPYQVAEYFIQAFLRDARLLGLKIAGEYPQRMPRATRFVPQMQALIRALLERQHAYIAADGCVYFSVQSFPEYGRLSGNTLDHLRGGAGGRVLDQHQAVKRHPADFLLWKPDASHLMKWDFPGVGTGYPGWHIECSAMARALLERDVIDIHTGGEDNIFPHHECEIAQTRGVTGQAHFARFWMHTRFLLVEGQKMSKSKGNFFTVRDVLEGRATGKAVDPAVLRYELLKAHYRSNMNFTLKGLEDSARAVRRLREAQAQFAAATAPGAGPAATELAGHAVVAQFTEALADDLNVAGALGAVFKWLGEPRDAPEVSLGVLQAVDSVLGVLAGPQAASVDDAALATLSRLLEENVEARARKDWKAADAARARLVALPEALKVDNRPGGGTAVETVSAVIVKMPGQPVQTQLKGITFERPAVQQDSSQRK